MTISEGSQVFAGNFCANLDEANADLVQFTKYGTGNGLPISRILLQKACSYKCQFYIKVCASSRLVSQVYDGWAKYLNENNLLMKNSDDIE